MDKTKKSKKGLLFIVAAPTGGGKTTIVNNALGFLQKNFFIERIVTYTTRQMRKNEEDGRDYIFVTREEFLRLQAAKHFFEITTYNDNLYGSPRDLVERIAEGKSFIAITDRVGIISYKKLYDKAVCVWIKPPSLEILGARLKKRGSESEDSLQRRLALAREEIAAEEHTPLCKYKILNTTIESATEKLIDIITSNLQTN
jgi:guanylate kinase